MATYWVNNVTGDNGNTGQNPVNLPVGTGPKLTWNHTIALLTGVGDIMNVMDTGTPYEVTSDGIVGGGAALAGTSEVNFGAMIRGVANDDSEDPAMVEVKFGAAVDMIQVENGQAYVLARGFFVNRPNTTFTGSSSALHFACLNDDGAGVVGPFIVERIHDKSTTALRGSLFRNTSLAGQVGGSFEVRYNFVENWHVESVTVPASFPNRTTSVHHNVWYQADATTEQAAFYAINDNNSTDSFVFNTIVHVNAAMDLLTYSATTETASSVKNIHSNVVADFSATAGGRAFLRGNVAHEDNPWDGTRLIGFNVFVDPGGHSWLTDQPYQVPWDPDDSDAPDDTGEYWPTDVVDETASADPFNDRLTPRDWTVLGYTITLPGDFRIVDQFRAVGFGGEVPGAIPDPIDEPSEPPIFDPGPSGLPVGPNAPAFLFDRPGDGIRSAVRVRRNTVLEVVERFEGAQESATHISDGVAIVSTNVAAVPVNLLPSSRLFMLEADTRIVVQLNSQTFVLAADGCVMIDGANLATFKVSNPSTVRRATLRYVGAR